MVDYYKDDTKRYRSTDYYALGEGRTDTFGNVEYPYATMSVTHKPKEWAIPFDNTDSVDPEIGLSNNYLTHVIKNFSHKNYDNLTDSESDALETISMSGIPKNNDEQGSFDYNVSTNPHFNPDKLFYEGDPSSITIDFLVADPSMPASTPLTLGALAKRDYKADEIVASDDLSKFSSKLTQNAIAKGLPVKAHKSNTNAIATNDINKRDRTIDADYIENNQSKVQPISPDTLQAARSDLRRMIRGNKKNTAQKNRNTTPVTQKGLSDQFVIPGMERFI